MAQDNAAQAIKDLAKSLNDADLKLEVLSKNVDKYFTNIYKAFSEAAKNANVSIDEMFRYIADKKSVVAAQKIKFTFDEADAKNKIDKISDLISDALANKKKKITIDGESINVSAAKGVLEKIKKEYEEVLKGMEDKLPKSFDDILNILNTSAGRKKQSSGTALGKARAKEMEGTQKAMAEINRLIEERNKLEANLQKQGHADKYYEKQRKGIEEVNRKIEEQKRLLSSYGGRGRQALSALGGDGSATALKKQEQNFRKLNMLLNERRKLEAQIKAQGGIANETQTRYQRILNAEIENTVTSMRELGKRYDGVTRQAAKNTMEERARRTKKTIDSLNGSLNQTRKDLSSMIPLLQRLGSAFGIAFSVRGLVQFGKKIIETRGQFEMQFVAMKQIIGDVDAATQIWNQTIQQALKSPFKAMQLVTYTKQLAAYRIETEKLFDTTKRLADVSAGLGVDMGRLILAYGQVKAANFLRASEIRQFTEAGVNILGELSKYFTELQGRAVSTAQVMEMVTKRMVKFEDVEAIFKRMTDEGGAFFNMQEVQADTVRGQIMKLHDAYDQMLNTIGKSNQGTIRNIVDILNRLVRNWEKVVFWIKLAGGAFVTFKVAQIAAGVAMVKGAKDATAESIGLSGLTARLVNLIAVEKTATDTTLTLSTALKQLNSSKGGWIGVAISAALTIAMGVYDYVQRATKLSKELNEITAETQMRSRKATSDYEQMAEKIRDVNTSEEERKETLSKLKRMYEDILPARMLEIEYITKEGNAYDDAKDSIKAYYEEKRKQESLDKVYEKYGKDVEEKQGDLVRFYDKMLGYAGYKVNEADINAVVNEMIEQYKAGQLALEDFMSTFEQLIQLQAGIDLGGKSIIPNNWFSRNVAKDSDYQDAIFFFNRMIHSVETLDEKIEEVTGSTAEFVGKQKELLQTNVFGDAEKNLFDSIANLSKDGALKSFNDELESLIANYEDYARLAYEKFKETFKQEYKASPTFFDDQFEKELEKRLGNLGIELKKNWEKNGRVIKYSIVDNQKVINSEIEKLAAKFGITDKEMLRQFQLDTSVEFDEWIKNQLAQLEIYKTEILRIQQGLLSGMDEKKVNMLMALAPAIPYWEEVLKGMTPSKTTTPPHNSKQYKSISTLISLLKEMNGEYDKLSKSAYGFARSQEKVTEAYSDTFKEVFGFLGLDISQVDFTDKAGTASAMELVMKKMEGHWGEFGKDGGKKAKQEFMKEFSKYTAEVDVEASVKLRKDFGKEMEKMFSDYDLTIDLEKFFLPTDELAGIFGLEVTTLNDLKNRLDEFYYGQASLGADPTDLVEQVEGYRKKIDEMEKKELRERLKTYTKYLEDGQGEALKIHLEELRQMAKLDELYEKGYFTDTQYKDISKKIKKETDEKLAKNDWQQFKESDFYVTMFEDMSRVSSDSIDVMIERLKKLRKNINDLNPKQAKEVVKAIEKLEKVKLERSPLKAFFEDRMVARDWRKNRDEWGKQLGFYASGEAYWSEEQEKQAKKVAELRMEYNELAKNGTPEDAADAKARLDYEEEELSRINEILEDRRKKLDEINQKQNEGYAANRRVLEGYAKGAQYFSEIASTAGTISTEIMDMMDGVSDATKQYAKDIADIAANTAMLAADIAKAIASKGSDVGSMIDGLVRTWNIIRGALSASERDINETIESNTEALKDLEEELERVQKAREKAWNTHDYVVAEKEIEQSIYDQIAAYNALIAAEEERKSSDKDQIRTWKQEREELFDQLEEEKERLLQDFGGIGESEYKSAAQGFVDAWKSAFLETGDGLQGLQDHFDEFLQDWFTKQLTMKYAAAALKPLFTMMDAAVDPNGIGGVEVIQQELDEMREWAKVYFPKIADELEKNASIWRLEGEGGLSGLAAGIQGMTEEQANILEAYWNSVRGYTENIDVNVATIVSILSNGGYGGDGSKGGVETNPMLSEIKLVAANTSSINALLQSVTKSGHGLGGSGIKVFVN